MSDWQGFSPLNDFTGPLLDNLKRHPKRIVFPEGEDVRVLRVSQRFVEEQAGAPILLGRREVITRMAEMNGISLKFVRIIEPGKSSDLQMFCDRYERAEQIQKETDKEVRITVPGHTQRGGSPCAYDRVLATRLGAEASRAILEGDFGCMVGTRNQEIIRVPLSEVAGKLKYVDPKASIIDEAKTIGISFGDE